AKEEKTNCGFSLEEMRALVELCYSEALGSERRDVVVQAERERAEGVLGVSEFLWGSGGGGGGSGEGG
ncbi:hypothetical protein LTS18_012096, partial [Coniosporium uncinatum]